MKQKVRVLLLVVCMLLATCCIFVACNNKTDDGGNSGDVTVTLSQQTLSLDLYEPATLEATVTGSTEDPTWSSSDSATVSVDQDGNIVGLKDGSATITASVGDASAQCTVTVDETGARPSFVGLSTSLELGVNDEQTLAPTVEYKGKTLSGLTISYTTEDADYITVSSDGTITALKVTAQNDPAVITVSTSYYDWTVSTPVNVTVVDDVTISLDVTNLALYISAPTEDFATTHQLVATITDNGTDIDSLENVTFASSDSDSVSVSDEGLISARKLTTSPVTITVTYTSVAGQTFTAECTVTVSKPVVEVETTTTEVEIDALDTSSATVALPLTNLTAVFEDVAADDITSVRDTEQSVTLTISASDGSILLTKAEIYSGERIYALETATCTYEIPVLMITKIIETPDDLDKMEDYSLTDPATDADAYYFMGYFELGNDIDYNKTIPAWCGFHQMGDANGASIGFMGTFDGKNHVISGMTVANNNSGFIGTVGTFGVVKNVAFVNAYLANQGTGVVAGFVNGTVENVIVHGTRGIQSTTWGPNGMICMKTGTTSAVIRNVLVIMEDFDFSEWDAVIIGRNDASGAVLMENAYGICLTDDALAYITKIYNSTNVSDTSGYTNILLEKTLAGLLSNENADFSGFTGWADDTTFGVPLPTKIVDLLESRDDLVYSVRITNESTEAYSGTTQVTVAAPDGSAVEYSIKETIDGVSIDSSTGIITVTGADMTEEEVQFTVVATVGDGEFDTWETTFTAYSRNLEVIDQTADVSLDMLATDGNVEITIEGLTTVSKVLDGATGEELDGFTQDGTTVTIPLNQFANFTTGERYVSILDETTRYNVLVTVYATITTKDQFIGMEDYLTADGDTLTGTIYLGANIDLEGATYNGIGEYTGSAGSYVFTDKWAGTFDGKGYTLSNFKITEDFGSMFAYITSDGVVTNLAIVDATIDGAKGGIVATLNEGEISDIFIKGEIVNGDGSGDALNGSYSQAGTTSTTLVTSTLSTSAKMQNIFAVLDDWSYNPNSFGGVIIGVARCTAYAVRGEYANVTNLYSINGRGRFVSSDPEDWLATGWSNWISSIGNEYGGRGVNRDTSDLNYLTDTDLILEKDPDNPNAGRTVDSFGNGYGELAAWLAEGNEFSGFDSDVWTTLDGLGYPVLKTAAAMVEASYDTEAILSLDSSLTEVRMNTPLTLKNGSDYAEKFPATYTLKDEISGVTLVDNVLTVDSTVEEGTEITVVGSSALFPDANVESTLVVRKVIEYADKDATVVIKTDSDESITLDISGVVDADDVIAVSVENGDAEATVTFSKASDTSLTLTLADITATSSGEKYIIVETVDTEYYFPLILADEEIVDEAGLIAFEEKIYSYAASEGTPPVPTEGSLTGYYVLTSDIDLSESTHVFGGTVAYGFFDGTFNGLGHSITGMTTGDMGLFKNVQENGVIKNLAIIDAVSTIDQTDGGNTPNGASIFAEFFHGTAQNIYISGTSGIGRWSYSGIFRQNYGTLIDCIFEVEQASGVTIDANATVLGYWDSSVSASDVVLITSSTKIHSAGSATAPTGVTIYTNGALATEGINIASFDSSIWSKDNNGNVLFNGKIVVNAPVKVDKEADLILKTSGDQTFTLDLSAVSGLKADAVTEVVETAEGKTITFAKATDTSLSLTMTDIIATASGEKYIRVRTADNAYDFPIILADVAIADNDGLKALDSALKAATGAGAGVSGYYVLTADLDFSQDAEFVMGDYVTGGYYIDNSGCGNVFSGTFNGMGNSITGVKVGRTGMFGNVTGTIKNVALIDIYANDQADDGSHPRGSNALCDFLTGTLENVYMSCSLGVTGYWYTGIFYESKGATIKDCVFEVTLRDNVKAADSVLGMVRTNTWEDVLVITASNKIMANNGGTGTESTSPDAENCRIYATETAACSGEDLSGFDSTIWSKDGSGNILFNGDIVVTAASA